MAVSTYHGITNIEGLEAGDTVSPGNSEMAAVGSVFVSTGIQHSGTYKLAVVSGGTANYLPIPVGFGSAGEASSGDKDVVLYRGYLYISFNGITAGTWMRILSFGDAWDTAPTERLYVEMNSTGAVRVNGGTASGNVLTTTGSYAYRIEVLGDADATEQEVRVNGATVCTNTAALSDMDFIAIGNFAAGSGTLVVAWDDILVESADNRLYINWPTDQPTTNDANLRMYQDGDDAVNNAWTAFGGGTKYDDVDEVVPDDDTTYIYTATLNNKQDFTYQTAAAAGISLAAGESIHAVKVQTKVRYSAATPSLSQRLISGATTNQTLARAATSAWRSHCSRVYQFDPNTGLDWTTSGLDAIKSGVEHYGGDTKQLDVTWQALSVDYGTELAVPEGPAGFNDDHALGSREMVR
jgi:hypothetical protein